jgi:hypothetical protein
LADHKKQILRLRLKMTLCLCHYRRGR